MKRLQIMRRDSACPWDLPHCRAVRNPGATRDMGCRGKRTGRLNHAVQSIPPEPRSSKSGAGSLGPTKRTGLSTRPFAYGPSSSLGGEGLDQVLVKTGYLFSDEGGIRFVFSIAIELGGLALKHNAQPFLKSLDELVHNERLSRVQLKTGLAPESSSIQLEKVR